MYGAWSRGHRASWRTITHGPPLVPPTPEVSHRSAHPLTVRGTPISATGGDDAARSYDGPPMADLPPLSALRLNESVWFTENSNARGEYLIEENCVIVEEPVG